MSYTSKKGWQDASHVAGPGWEGYVPAGKGFLEYRRRIPGTRRGVVVKAKSPPPGYPHDGLSYRVGLFGHPQGWGSDRMLWFEETRSRVAALDIGDRVVERGYVQVAAVEADAAKKKAAHRVGRIGTACKNPHKPFKFHEHPRHSFRNATTGEVPTMAEWAEMEHRARQIIDNYRYRSPEQLEWAARVDPAYYADVVVLGSAFGSRMLSKERSR